MPAFRNLAVASTFSPRFLPLLSEARRFAGRLGGTFGVVHAGERDEKSERIFANAFRDFAIEPAVYWCEKFILPSDAILDAVAREQVDLLMLGALERETKMEGRQFLGEVARRVMRTAPCSLLFFTHPQIDAAPLRTIVVATDYSDISRRALDLALALAGSGVGVKIYVLSVLTVFAQARAAQEGHDLPVEKEQARLDDFIAGIDAGSAEVDTRCIEGTTGFAAADFVRAVRADFLIVPSPLSEASEATFPNGMNWILETIPTNLLLLRH